MKEMILEAGERFDFIFIDTPPILAVVDGIIISGLSDGIIFVILAGKTDRKPFVRAIEQLKNSEVNILGVLHNESKVDRISSYYRHYSNRHYRDNGYTAGDGEELKAGEKSAIRIRSRKRSGSSDYKRDPVEDDGRSDRDYSNNIRSHVRSEYYVDSVDKSEKKKGKLFKIQLKL